MTTVLITGANRGIGLALARAYANDGAEVIACCRAPSTADELNALVAEPGRRVQVVQLDASDPSSIARLRDAVGDRCVDILINNAGITGTPKDQSATRIDPDNWLDVMRVNALAPLLVSQALRENLVRSSEKKLVAISSCYGSTGKDYGAGIPTSLNRYAYRASKAALNNGMRGLARDWASDGVVVGILEPGFVATGMTTHATRDRSGALSAEESALGIKDCIASLGPEGSGTFQRYWGESIPW